MTRKPNWKPIDTMPEDRQRLRRQGNLYWADGMYVYYQPTHWSEP